MKKKIIITTGAVAIAGGVATALFMSSCDPCEWAEQPSVIVHIVDRDAEKGNGRVGADAVWWEHTDEFGNEVSVRAECFGDGDGNQECSKWKVGYGEPGVYEIHASVCGQEFSTKVDVEAEEGLCEFETAVTDLLVSVKDCEPDGTAIAPELPLKSKKVECDKWAQPSIIAHLRARVADNLLLPVGATKSYYTWDGAPDERELETKCLNEECSVFAAGWEKTGHFTVVAEACGEVTRAEVAVQKTDDSCHVATEEVLLTVDGSKCDELDKIDPNNPPPRCEPKLVPSAFIFPIRKVDDMWMPVGTQSLVFSDGTTRHKGYCIDEGPNNQCTKWIAGWGRSGRFSAYTETCGEETGFEYVVETTEDECYPVTKYIYVDVDTHGCISAPTPDPGGIDPIPATPVDATR